MTTLVFPGQGSQYIGMAKDFYNNYNSAKNVFDKVEESTKMKVKDIIFNNPENMLNYTEYTQICIFTASMAIFEVFKEQFINTELFSIDYVLGHSLGEYTALTASKSFSIEDCSSLLKIRGKLMQKAYKENKSGMAALIGLNCEKVERIIKEKSLNIEIANDNAPGQVVISGIVENIKKSEEILINNGVKKIVYLNVSAAFHSKIMKNAEDKMKNYLSNTILNNPIYPVVSNFSANYNNKKLKIFEDLSRQMSNKVRWLESIMLLEKKKENLIIEIGPGKVLTGLIRRISKNFKLYNFCEVKDIEVIRNAI